MKNQMNLMKMVTSKKYKKVPVVVMVLLAVSLFAYEEVQKRIPLQQDDGVQFARCVDGDTARFLVEGKEQNVRFLAVDTPETVKPNAPVEPYGKEASEYTCDRISTAKEIRLEYEDSNKTDKYGRLLAWVWVDGSLLQLELINEGLAEVKYLYGDYRYTDQLLGAQEHAKQEKTGQWSE